MFNNNGKNSISRYFLFSIFVICLVFTSIGFNIEDSYAVDVNQSNAEMDLEVDAQDKLENSQFENNVLGANNDEDVLGTTYKLNGGTFQKIQDTVNNAKSGDEIQLSGTFTASNGLEKIQISKKLKITSTSQATLDAKKMSNIFFLDKKAQGCTISNLKFINGVHDVNGAAILLSANDVTISNCVFENNYAKNAGGAVSSRYNPTYAVNAVVKNCVFRNNGAKIAGGALTLYGDNSKVIDCIFDSNYATNNEKIQVYGGAVQLSRDEIESVAYVTGCTFINNWAKSNSDTPSHGGAGCIRDGVFYTNCLFKGNSADEGGALTFHASGVIKNCSFIDNEATKFGGAISTGFLYTSMSLNILDSVFNNNSAPLGGAVQAMGENIKIEGSDFTDNYASQNGGAVNIEATTVTVTQNNFINNTANVDGGAIFAHGKTVIIQDSVFNSNDAIPDKTKLNDGLGGAVYVNSTNTDILSNVFKYNTARNGSAIYYDKSGINLVVSDNVMHENQAWVYALPISAEDIYFGESENITSVIHGGNNIARFGNLAVSNAIYNAAGNTYISVDGFNPINGATDTGELYQDDREYQIDILLTVEHEDGSLVYNNTLKSSYLGEINTVLTDLKPGKYYVTAKHFEDTYYKAITNTTSFTVYPKVDNQIRITSDKIVYDYEDVVIWTVNVTNAGPNNSTGVIVSEILPEGLIYVSDTSEGLYDPHTGVLNISTLDVGEKLSFDIVTVANKTGEISNDVNVTANEFDTNLDNNLDSRPIFVNPACDIQVVKSVNDTSPDYHDLVNWTVVVRNNGPDTAHNISIRDIVPDGLIPLNYSSNELSWKIDSLEVNGERVFNIITLVNATGIIENNAEAYAQEFDYDLSNNNDNEIIRVSPACDLSIEKLANATLINYLDIIRWTLIIRNNGPDDATGVKATDILPEGFIYISSTLELEDDMIDIGNLAVGKSVTVDIICKADTTGNFTNYANVTGNEYDPDLNNNRDNKSVTVKPAADVQINKTVDEEEPNNGEVIVWTVTVRNNGPDTAHEIVVHDLLPDSMIWIEDDSLGDFNPETGIWSIDSLDIDEEEELNIVCRLNRAGITVNSVNVTALEFDYNLDNNHANESIEVKPSADVSIIKLVNNTSPNYNDLITWTVIATNNGPDKATGVEVSEILPSGLILVSSTPTKGIFDNDLWFLCCLENGENESLEIVCRVNKTGKMTNSVNITANENDPNSTNNIDNESVEVPPAVDIEVIQNVNSSSPLFGERITWIIKITNNGPDNATEVKLTDILPETLIYVDYSSSTGDYTGDIWDIGRLNAGCSEYLNITCIANDLGQTVNNAHAKSYEYDWNMSNNHDDAQIDVLPVADVAIEKMVDNANPNYGDLIVWTLKITNNGPNDASNVVVSDVLPEGLEFIKSDDKNFDGKTWNVGSLALGEIKQLAIKCKVVATGLIKNSANVSCDEFDPDVDNNHAEESISVAPASDLSVSKIASRYEYVLGDVITYVIEVVNNGPDTAYNIKVSEVLDDLLKLKSFKASKGNFNKFTKVWTIDRLGFGEYATLYIKAVAMGTGILKNTVVVSSDSFDFDKSNNKDYAIVKVVKKAPEIISDEPEDKEVKLPGKKLSNLEIHSTANPLLILLVSCVVSIIFLGDDISKRR